jgi:Asparagine synthase (glutamine-hydrolyzing)
VSCGALNNGTDINIYHHKLQDCFSYEEDGISAAIIGHAYNPFDMNYQEIEILKDCIYSYQQSRQAFFNKISELTGIHLIIINDKTSLLVVQDCGGMKSCYFGKVNSDIYLTSHPQLVGDICRLQRDPFVEKLTAKWFFSKGSKYLPGNLSPYPELKRLGPNTYLEYSQEFRMNRFYPVKPHIELSPDKYDDVLDRIGELISKNIELCALKWRKPAISLSGGMDSKTTLACTNGIYDKFKYFSFHCKPAEVVDANAAHKLCAKIGLDHKIYAIPDTNDQLQDYEVLKRIICHNSSNIGVPYDHEIRKFIFLYKLKDYDVELKSWISEIGRAMWERKYGINLPKIFSPRHFSIFQTRYIFAPILLKKSDNYYKKYLKEINLNKPLYNYEHSDFFYWEFRFGSWGTTVVTTQDIFGYRVTMPINNRKLIDMFLWFPHEYRKNDMVNKETINRHNKKIADANISVHNTYLGGRRIFMEKMYYYYRTILQRGIED